jgi:hypothetical protein
MSDLSKRLELLFDNQILQSILRTRINLLDYWGASIYVLTVMDLATMHDAFSDLGAS